MEENLATHFNIKIYNPGLENMKTDEKTGLWHIDWTQTKWEAFQQKLPKELTVFPLDEKYHEAFEKEIGIYGSHYTNTMMVELGVTLHFAAGSDKNIKLTTKDDLDLFKGYLAKGADNGLK